MLGYQRKCCECVKANKLNKLFLNFRRKYPGNILSTRAKSIYCIFADDNSSRLTDRNVTIIARPSSGFFTLYYTPPKPHFSSRVPIVCQLHEHAKKLSQKQFEVGQRPTHLPSYAPASPALYLVWQCYAYSQYKVQDTYGQNGGEFGPLQLQSNKVSDSINHHSFI